MNIMKRARPLPVLPLVLSAPALLSLLGLLSLSILSPPPLQAPAQAVDAGQQDVTLNVALLGDSYSAGSGAGDYEAEDPDDPGGKAYRSRNSWAHHYVDWLNERGAHATLTNLAHSSSTTGDVINEQIGEMPSDTDLVMLTIGGNDVHFPDIVKRCFMVGLRSASGCRETVQTADSRLESEAVEGGVAVPSVRSQTRSILEKLDAKLADGAQVVLVGYPYLSMGSKEYVLAGAGGASYGAGTGVRSLSERARESQSALVDEWNTAHSSTLKVTYIDSTMTAFSGHEPDPLAAGRNEYRWINEFLETEGSLDEDGRTASHASFDSSMFYRPNKIGHERIAELIEDEVGVPGNARPVAPASAGLDVVFAVSGAGSMGDDVAAMRTNMRSIAERAAASSSSCRFALVSYAGRSQDDPNGRPARTDVDFTSDATAIENGLDALALENDGASGAPGDSGTPGDSASQGDSASRGAASTSDASGAASAPVYSGIMEAVGLDWRSGVRKEVVVIGDRPAADPEPGTGDTAASVAHAAYAADPVRIHAIDTSGAAGPGASDFSESFRTLASAGGSGVVDAADVVDSASPDGLPELIGDALTAEQSKPFAWIQGDYVIQAGDSLTIDASASYAASGQIVSYEWDFDGDGAYDQTTTAPTVEHAFPDEFEGVVGVRATQSDGLSAMATSPIMVTDDGDQTPRESDNCPDINNWGQTDEDADGVGDECDSSPGSPDEDEARVSEVADGAAAPTDDSADPADPSDPAAGSPSAVPAADRTVPDASSAPVVAAPDDASGALGDSADPGIAVVSPVVVSVPSSSSAAGGSAMLARTGISAPDAALAAALIVVGGISMAMCIHRRSRR